MTGPNFVGVGAPRDPLEGTGARLTNVSGTSPRGTPGAASNQRKTFVLMDRIQAAFNAFRYPDGLHPVDTDASTLDTGTSAGARTWQWQEYFKTDNSRMQVYEDVKEMDETTDEVSAGLDTLADSAVNPEDGSQFCFVIEIDEGEFRDQAEAVFDQVTESLDLHRNAFAIARDFLKFGDCFVELVVDDTNKLARLKFLPQGTLFRNEDAAGNLMDGDPRYDREGHCVNKPGQCAFDQREQLNGKLIASFYDWQITHFRWNRRGGDRYGRSHLRTARMVWKKLRAVEEAMVIARLQRAWMRFVHHVDTTGMDREAARQALQSYRQDLTKRFILDQQLRDSPFEVTSDFYLSAGYIRDLDGNKYLPKMSKIEVLQGDHAVLSSLNDVEYFQNKLFASIRVPKAYLGFERDVNAKATLTTQDIQFARILRRIQATLSQGYKEIFDFALMLAGIDPAQVSYTVRWPAILVSDEERDAIIRMYHARSDATYWQMGAPSTKYLVQQRYGWDDEAWVADLNARLADPPPRVKIVQLQNPGENKVDDGNGDTNGQGDRPGDGAAQQQNLDQQRVQDPDGLTPLERSIQRTTIANVTDAPPDSFAQNKASTQQEVRHTQHVGHRNPSRSTGRVGQIREGDNDLDGDDEFKNLLEEFGLSEDEMGSLYDLDGNGYDPNMVHGLGAPYGGASGGNNSGPRVFIPGSARSRWIADRDAAWRRGNAALSVNGVHGLASRMPGMERIRGAGLPNTSAGVRSAASRELQGFIIDLMARKQRAISGN